MMNEIMLTVLLFGVTAFYSAILLKLSEVIGIIGESSAKKTISILIKIMITMAGIECVLGFFGILAWIWS